MNQAVAEVHAFIKGWVDSPDGNKQIFIRLFEALTSHGERIRISFHPRPGVTYSLRAEVPGFDRPLIAMVDVIDDQPRWLSVCFYADMITDPEEQGAFVPGGLQGADACCFDLDAPAESAAAYVIARLEEAIRAALAA